MYIKEALEDYVADCIARRARHDSVMGVVSEIDPNAHISYSGVAIRVEKMGCSAVIFPDSSELDAPEPKDLDYATKLQRDLARRGLRFKLTKYFIGLESRQTLNTLVALNEYG